MKTNIFTCLLFLLPLLYPGHALAQNKIIEGNQLNLKCRGNVHFFWSKVLQKCVDSTMFDRVLFPYTQNKTTATQEAFIGLIFDANLQRVEVFTFEGSLILHKNELRQSYEDSDQNIILRQKNGTWFYAAIKAGTVAQSVKLYASN